MQAPRRPWRQPPLLPLLFLTACAGVAGEVSDRLSVLATQSCVGTARATERVAPGVTLHYDNAFFCSDAPVRERYTFTVRVTNPASSTVSATLQGLELRLSTPAPRQGPRGDRRGQRPPADAGAGGERELCGERSLRARPHGRRGKSQRALSRARGGWKPLSPRSQRALSWGERARSGAARGPARRPPRRPGPPPRPGPG